MLSDYHGSISVNVDVAVGPDNRSRVVWYDERPDGPYTAMYQWFDIVEENYSPDLPLFSEYPGHSATGRPFIEVNDDNTSYSYCPGTIEGSGSYIFVHHFADDLIMSEAVYFGENQYTGTLSDCACFDLEGNFWIVYQEAILSQAAVVVFARSISPSDELSDAIQVSPEEFKSNHYPAGITCDRFGELHCAFATVVDDPSANTQQLFYARTIGGVWQPAEQATNIPKSGRPSRHRIGVDSQGRAYLIFASTAVADEGGPYISLIRRDPGGWSEPVDAFPGLGTCSGLALVIDGDDNINVFHSPHTPYEKENSFRRGYNGSWSKVYEISEGKVSRPYPADIFELNAECSSSGAISVVWENGEALHLRPQDVGVAPGFGNKFPKQQMGTGIICN
jgi:hypothetical protein